MPVICRHCMKSYSCQSNLNRHLKEKHELSSEIIAYGDSVKSFKCLEGCDLSFAFNAELVMHLKSEHNIEIEKEEHRFGSMEEFQLWLTNYQNLNYVEYIHPRGKIVLPNKDSVIYYNCNRSGNTRDASKVNKRMKKIQGTKKINFSCTSQIKVVINKENSSVATTFLKSHYGHDFQIRHLWLPKEEKKNIAEKLTIGVNMKRILDDNRDNFNECKLKRTDLLTRKDICNIKTSFNIQIQEGVRHPEDAMSIDIYVQECYQSESNPILFYKPQNVEDNLKILKIDDFCLIIMNSSQKNMLMKFGHNIVCIDSTHGLNSYDFELTTLLVVDDWGEGFPGACMLTNRKDSLIFEIFYQQLKNEIGVLRPKTFMTDITNVFYNPWKTVMGEVQFQLYCAWHIDRAWQSNLNKIGNQEKKKTVYSTLKLLQTSANREDFHKIMSNFIVELLQDCETFKFGQYFKAHYEHCYQKWAYCYRQSSGINTNMRLESMHKLLKHIYLDGKKVKRLDKGLYALNKYIRDKIVDRILKKVKGKNSWHMQNIQNRHKSALTANLEIIGRENFSWALISKAPSNTQTNLSSHKVERISSAAPCCNLICAICKICVHSFICSCPDYYIHNTICKHIHYVVLQNNVSNMSTESCLKNTSIIETTDENSEEISQHLQTLTRDNNNVKSTEKLLSTISTQVSKLEENCRNVKKTEILKHVVKTLTTENILVERNFSESLTFNAEKSKEPANKNIEKQLSFHSTKKRRKTHNNYLHKPNFEEKKEIKNHFMNRNMEYISKSPENDHAHL